MNGTWGLVVGLVLGLGMGQAELGAATGTETPFHVYDRHGKRDPFIPLVIDGQMVTVTDTDEDATADASTLKLIGILWDPGGHSLALINENEAQVGDRINGYQVTEIRQDRVVLKSASGTVVVLEISFDTPTKKPNEATKSNESKKGGGGP